MRYIYYQGIQPNAFICVIVCLNFTFLGLKATVNLIAAEKFITSTQHSDITCSKTGRIRHGSKELLKMERSTDEINRCIVFPDYTSSQAIHHHTARIINLRFLRFNSWPNCVAILKKYRQTWLWLKFSVHEEDAGSLDSENLPITIKKIRPI